MQLNGWSTPQMARRYGASAVTPPRISVRNASSSFLLAGSLTKGQNGPPRLASNPARAVDHDAPSWPERPTGTHGIERTTQAQPGVAPPPTSSKMSLNLDGQPTAEPIEHDSPNAANIRIRAQKSSWFRAAQPLGQQCASRRLCRLRAAAPVPHYRRQLSRTLHRALPIVTVSVVQARACSLTVMPRPGRSDRCIRPSLISSRSLNNGYSQSKCSTHGSCG